ncbi:MAG: hypothetical protein M3O15_14945 [Acidobacteriota bacterium]|nr:hypothetical protein [Acidobacteriota bacterium]
MKRSVGAFALALFLAVPLAIFSAPKGGGERAEHPRISHAITALNQAIEYLEKAPHDFGGHRAEAVEASKKAVEQLKLALQYDKKHEAH